MMNSKAGMCTKYYVHCSYHALQFVLLLSNRYQQYGSEFEPVEISTPRYEPERYYKPEYQTERSSYDYNKPEFQTERSSYDYEQPEFETQRPSYDYKPEPKPDNRYYNPEYQTERSSYDYEQPEFQTQKPNNYESQLEVTVTPQYSEFHDEPVTSKYYQYNDEYASPSPLGTIHLLRKLLKLPFPLPLPLRNSSEFMGKTIQAAQITHERFLTIDHSCKIFF